MEENESLLRKIFKSFSKEEGLDELLIMSEHWDGYKREDAVRRLGTLGNPIAIPKLLVRVNDWVFQVRQAARESLEKLLIDENAEAFILSLPDLYHLQDCGRDGHQTLISNVTDYLLKPNNVKYIKNAIKNYDPYVARIAVKLLFENALVDKQELVSECLSHSDLVVRSMASNLLRDFSGEILDSFLKKSIKDPFMPIRREAFQLYLKVNPELGLEIANMFIFDRHISIREIAIKQLLKNNYDVEKILINALKSDVQTALKIRCAITGLTDIGSKRSIPIISDFFTNTLPSIRKASLHALARLIGDESKSYLLIGLQDKSPSVAKESSRILNKLRIKLSSKELLDIVMTTNYNHTLLVCISSAKKINKWDRLIFLFSLMGLFAQKNSTEAEVLAKELSKWDNDFNRSSSQPSNEQIESMGLKFSKCKDILGSEIRRSIEFTINGVGTK